MSERDAFLGRWSRRKTLARREPPPAEKGCREQPEAPSVDRADGGRKTAEPPLPDIGSLGRDSDFAAFMREGVPEGLRKQALRKLWRLDPAFSKLDGLLEYGEDYNAPARRPAVVRTAWRIGRGMAPDEAPDEPQEAAAEEPGEEEGAAGIAGPEAGAGADEEPGKGSV